MSRSCETLENSKPKLKRFLERIFWWWPSFLSWWGSHSLANLFLAHEQIWFNDCPDEFKPVYYKRYVDDIFVLFWSPHHLEKFNEYLNTKHVNIKFTSEKEVNRSLPFLNVLISWNKVYLVRFDKYILNLLFL